MVSSMQFCDPWAEKLRMREPISSAGADCGGIAVGIWRRRRGREETERREVRVAAGQAIKFGRPAVSSCSSGFGICWGQTQTVRRRGGLVGQRVVITQSHLFPSLLSLGSLAPFAFVLFFSYKTCQRCHLSVRFRTADLFSRAARWVLSLICGYLLPFSFFIIVDSIWSARTFNENMRCFLFLLMPCLDSKNFWTKTSH